MEILWSRELRQTTGASNKFYRLELHQDGNGDEKLFIVRTLWGRIGNNPNMQDKYKTASKASAENQIKKLISMKQKKGYKQHKTIDHVKENQKKVKDATKMSSTEIKKSRFRRFVTK